MASCTRSSNKTPFSQLVRIGRIQDDEARGIVCHEKREGAPRRPPVFLPFLESRTQSLAPARPPAHRGTALQYLGTECGTVTIGCDLVQPRLNGHEALVGRGQFPRTVQGRKQGFGNRLRAKVAPCDPYRTEELNVFSIHVDILDPEPQSLPVSRHGGFCHLDLVLSSAV
jgi:hypothetical protein